MTVGSKSGSLYQSNLTAHGALIADSSQLVKSVTPSATSGVPIISQGTSADPAFGTAVVAGGGTGIVTTTAYAPICGGTTATGNFQAADSGISNSGYVLTSTGAASVPTWQAAAGGGGTTGLNYVLLSSQTASSSSSINFTSFVSSSYEYYVIDMLNVIPANTNTSILLQVSDNNGSSYINSNYSWGQGVLYSGNLVFEAGSGSDSSLNIADSVSNVAAGGHSGYVTLYDLNEPTLLFKYNGFSNQWDNSSNLVSRWSTGGYKTNDTLNAFTVFMSAGNISSGTFNLYGVQANGSGNLPAGGQLLFLANVGSGTSNCTGDGTAFNPKYDNVIVNVGSCYDSSTYTFTAPKNGNYSFASLIELTGIAIGHTSFQMSYSGPTTYYNFYGNPFYISDQTAGGLLIYNFGTYNVTLTLGQTMNMGILVSGSTKTINSIGGNSNSFFSCTLLS